MLLSKDTRAGNYWHQTGSHAQSVSLALAGADWQSSAPPHLPMAMHSCRIWPKGRRRLNWSCPSKERESYREVGPRRKERERRGAGRQQPLSRCQCLAEEAGALHHASPSLLRPCTAQLCLPGSRTLVTVGEVSGARAIDQTVRGPGTVLCGTRHMVRPAGGDGDAGGGRGPLPLGRLGGGSPRRPGCEWAGTISGGYVPKEP